MGNKHNFTTNHDKYIKCIHLSNIAESAARMMAFMTILFSFFVFLENFNLTAN